MLEVTVYRPHKLCYQCCIVKLKDYALKNYSPEIYTTCAVSYLTLRCTTGLIHIRKYYQTFEVYDFLLLFSVTSVIYGHDLGIKTEEKSCSS